MAFSEITASQMDPDSEHLRALWRQIRDNIDDLYDDTRKATVVKSADEDVTNSIALQSDDELLFAAAANEVWRFELHILVSTSVAGHGIRLSVSGPAGVTRGYTIMGLNDDGFGAGDQMVTRIGTGSVQDFLPTGAMASVPYIVTGVVSTAAAAGNIVLQWGQSVAGAGTWTRVCQNSSLNAWRLDAAT